MATIVRVVSDNISVSDYVDGHRSTGARVTQVFESVRDGVAACAELGADGRISMRLQGSAPQGEKDTLRVARVLIAKLNADGADWMEPEASDGPADFEARSKSRPDRLLRAQVVRAIVTEGLWRRLAHHKTDSSNWSAEELLEEVRKAIKHKTANKYSPKDCSTMHLLLDANRLPALALTEFQENAVRSLEEELRGTPFQAIWIVGRAPSFSFALWGHA